MNITYEEAQKYVGKTCIVIEESNETLWILKISEINKDMQIKITECKQSLKEPFKASNNTWGNVSHAKSISLFPINEHNI